MIPVAGCSLTDDDIEQACAVLRSRQLTMGAQCRALEGMFAAYVGRRHALFVNSGSSANLLAFFAMDAADFMALPPIRGREVIVPALTWSTTVWPIVQAGGIPVFVDCDRRTLQADPVLVNDALTDKTAAVCMVHVLGGVSPLSDEPDASVWYIEDTCESLGATVGPAKAGAIGDLATFSFYFSHQMNTIEGGMIVTDDDRLADLLRAMRSNGWTRDMIDGRKIEAANPTIDPRFLFATTGFNLRPTEVQAALGLAQLPRLDTMNATRRSIATRIADAAAKAGIETMHAEFAVVPAPFGVPLLCPERDRLRAHLADHEIATRPIIAGNIVRHPAMAKVAHRVHGTLTNSDWVMDNGLYIGAHPAMTEEDVAHVCAVLDSFA